MRRFKFRKKNYSNPTTKQLLHTVKKYILPNMVFSQLFICQIPDGVPV